LSGAWRSADAVVGIVLEAVREVEPGRKESAHG
jgi:hypothetical protein